jgi:thiamine biosynthesis lipoprotein
MVMDPAESLALADSLPGVAARVTGVDGIVGRSALWRTLAADAPARLIPAQTARAAAWPKGWQALATFTAPRRQLIRDPDFRSPYMAMWITDLNNRPVRTLLLVGKFAGWQRDNFIWWNSNPGQTDRLVSVRAMGTSGIGVYNVFWDGVDDFNRVVPAGRYILHVETSRERGKHTYRSMNLDFGKAAKFKAALAPTEEGGGLEVSYDRY